jgi:hypothetical protein
MQPNARSGSHSRIRRRGPRPPSLQPLAPPRCPAAATASATTPLQKSPQPHRPATAHGPRTNPGLPALQGQSAGGGRSPHHRRRAELAAEDHGTTPPPNRHRERRRRREEEGPPPGEKVPAAVVAARASPGGSSDGGEREGGAAEVGRLGRRRGRLPCRLTLRRRGGLFSLSKYYIVAV